MLLISPRGSVATIVKCYAGKAGLTVDDFSGHSLRSGFITSGAAASADLFKLMEVSRHKKPETVMGYVRESKLFENHAGEKFLWLNFIFEGYYPVSSKKIRDQSQIPTGIW